MEYIWYLLTSIIWIMLGLTWWGGSILAVPLLVYIFNIDPVLATSYSLWLVGLTSLLAVIPKYRSWQIDIKTGVIFGIPSLIGVTLVRTYMMPLLPETISIIDYNISKWAIIMIVFSIIMLLAAFSMIKPKQQEKETTPSHSYLNNKYVRYLLIIWEGLIVWGITGFVWAWWWFLIIPALVFFTKMPIKTAIWTSLLVISIKSLLWFIGDISHLTIDWRFFSIISIISILWMLLWNYIQHFIDDKKIKVLFGYFILIIWWFIIIKELLL